MKAERPAVGHQKADHFLLIRVALETAAGIDGAGDAESVQLPQEVSGGIDLVIETELRPLGQTGVQDQGRQCAGHEDTGRPDPEDRYDRHLSAGRSLCVGRFEPVLQSPSGTLGKTFSPKFRLLDEPHQEESPKKRVFNSEDSSTSAGSATFRFRDAPHVNGLGCPWYFACLEISIRLPLPETIAAVVLQLP